MKIIGLFHNKRLITAFIVSVSSIIFNACSHKSNDEDDTFKQSTIDNLNRANRKEEKAIKHDSIRLGDTARTDKDTPL